MDEVHIAEESCLILPVVYVSKTKPCMSRYRSCHIYRGSDRRSACALSASSIEGQMLKGHMQFCDLAPSKCGKTYGGVGSVGRGDEEGTHPC